MTTHGQRRQRRQCLQRSLPRVQGQAITLAVALCAFLVSPGSVLCVADGAHASLEVVLDSCCTVGPGESRAEPPRSDASLHAGQRPGGQGCTGCVDVILDSSTVVSKRLELGSPVVAAAPGAADLAGTPRLAGHAGGPEPQTPVPPDLGLLSSVTLLI
jgi:hypothetical protein